MVLLTPNSMLESLHTSREVLKRGMDEEIYDGDVQDSPSSQLFFIFIYFYYYYYFYYFSILAYTLTERCQQRLCIYIYLNLSF